MKLNKILDYYTKSKLISTNCSQNLTKPNIETHHLLVEAMSQLMVKKIDDGGDSRGNVLVVDEMVK